MANKRVLVKRRKAIRNIRKITRTMQLIATARFQAAMTRSVASRPYTERLAQLVSDLAAGAGEVTHPLMTPHPDAKRSATLVITSSRGFCGGYNINVLRAAVAHLDARQSEGIESDVLMVGKKGVNYFRFLGRSTSEQITHISDAPRFEEIEPLANALMDRFRAGEIASAHVAYMKFLSAGKQVPHVLQLLPLTHDASSEPTADESKTRPDYEYSPDRKELLDVLLPATVRASLFQCFNDATVSEHLARMVAMKAATDAANDMITLLSRKYNRARQTHITMELLDIVGGANALS